MRVFQILLLTFGLIVLGNILSKVSAQNNSNKKVNSNTASNRYSANYGMNDNPSRSNSNVAAQTVSSDSEDDEYAYNFGEVPTILKIISMKRTVKFPANGALEVEIIEEVGKPFTIRFARDNETVAQYVMRNPNGGYIREYFHSPVDPKVRFKVIEIEGLPTPIIHLMMVQPGGSGYGFWSSLFGEVNGKIKLLTPPTTQFSWEGGVQIGNLGEGNGTGVAVWNSIWEDGESHYGEHFYEVEFYNFNKKLGKFVKTKKIKTKQKQENPNKALESLDLGFYKDAVRDFPEFIRYREEF
jgi:hypothetical protein